MYYRSVCIYQAQVVWICLCEKQIRETTVDVTLQTSFGYGEILEFEETVVTGIFSSEQICNRDTHRSPLDIRIERTIIWLISCIYIAT